MGAPRHRSDPCTSFGPPSGLVTSWIGALVSAHVWGQDPSAFVCLIRVAQRSYRTAMVAAVELYLAKAGVC